jgi:hypothetical protein
VSLNGSSTDHGVDGSSSIRKAAGPTRYRQFHRREPICYGSHLPRERLIPLLEEHLGGSDKSEIRSGGLSPIQKDIARFSGITEKEYADNLKELERQKSIGNYQ